MSDVKTATIRILMVSALFVGLLAAGASMAQDLDADGKADAGKAAQKPDDLSLLDLLVKGGPVMIPIGLCSVLALAFTIERLISLKREKVIPRIFLDGLAGAFGGARDIDEGMAYCAEHPSPLSNIFKSGLNRLPQGPEAMEKAIEDAGGREVAKMKRSLKPLSVIANVAPLLGLLGTVYGLITAFQTATAGGAEDKANTLATGIYEALVTTAAGLTLAIPVLIVYALLNTKVDVLIDRMDEEALGFIEHAAYGKPLPVASDESADESEVLAVVEAPAEGDDA